MFFHPGECLLSGTTALTTTRRLQICLLERILHFPPALKGFPQLFLLNAPKTFSSDAFLSSKCFAAASQSWPACQRLRMAKPVFLASFLLLCFFYASANTLLIKCMFMYADLSVGNSAFCGLPSQRRNGHADTQQIAAPV